MEAATTIAGLEAPRLLENLVLEAQAASASDVHVQLDGTGVHIHFRLDGVLTPIRTIDPPLAERLVGRVKFLGRLKTYQSALPQEGRIPRADVGSEQDIRVATYPTVNGEKLVLRLFQSEGADRGLAELGLSSAQLKEVEHFLASPSGLLLLTGPAGSGKTTTIYACLRHLAGQRIGRHVITIEDPVEQVVPGVMQTEVNEAMGLTFSKAAKHLLRQDPQVLVLGEIRDDETANLVVRASLTGHLVISTLHAGSSAGVVDRLSLMCPDPYAVASGLSLILNQRLVRRTCRHCAGRGCRKCADTGYHGRTPVTELLCIDDAIRSRIRTGSTTGVVTKPSLAEAGRALVDSGITTVDELQRVLGHSI